MPYHPDLGLTKEEHAELQRYSKNIELSSSGNAGITINKKGDIIQFDADGKLALLKAIKMDIVKNIVTIGEYILSFSESLNILDVNNGFKSKWKGFKWTFEDPKNLDINALKDLQTFKAKIYKFIIGRLEKNGKTIMIIEGREFENGAKQVSFNLPLILNN